jgi:HEPN domain-containing protein
MASRIIENNRFARQRKQGEVPEATVAFFDTLSAYYLNNRYPDYVSKLNSQIDAAEAARIMKKTKEVFAWLLTLKP